MDESTGLRDSIRVAELALATLVIAAFVGSLLVPPLYATITAREPIAVGVMVLAPLLLAVAGAIGTAAADVGIGSVVVVLTVLPTAYFAGGCLILLLFPPEGGGVFIGPLIAFLLGAILGIAVILRPRINAATAGVWHRPPLIAR